MNQISDICLWVYKKRSFGDIIRKINGRGEDIESRKYHML